MSKRSKIKEALIEKIKEIDGTGTYNTTLYGNVHNKLKFWDEVNDFPSVFVTAGTEVREYHPGEFKWGFLNITIRVYVQGDNPEEELELIFGDLESVIDANGNLVYDTNSFVEDINILSINTDEGLLSPIGVGEITIQVRYEV